MNAANNLHLVPYFCFKNILRAWNDENSSHLKNLVQFVASDSFFIPTPNENLIAEAFQAEVVFSHANDDKPILASYGAGPCVIACGYEPNHRVGFMAHFSHNGEVSNGTLIIVSHLHKILRGKSGKFHLNLRGGIPTNPNSKKILSAIEKLVQWAKSSPFKISFEVHSIKTLGGETDNSESLALDTRNGMMAEYDPLKNNPHNYRKLTREDMIWAQKSYEEAPRLKISYLADAVSA